MFTFACPSCRERSEWRDDWDGDRVDCPSCHEPMKLRRPRYDEDDDRLEIVRRRWDEDDEREDDRPRSRRRRRDEYDEFTCFACDYRGRPRHVKEMAEMAWVLIVIGILFWPLLVLGILMRETWEVCPDCGRRGRKVGGTTFGG